MMRECVHCHVKINDHTRICPLCHCVLDDRTENADKTEDKAEDRTEDKTVYPEVRMMTRRLQLLLRIYLFFAVIVSIVLVIINIRAWPAGYWGFLLSALLIYVYVALRCILTDTAGYRTRFFMILSVIIAAALLMDYFSGFHKWSLTYGLPTAICVTDGAILLLMIINRRNWQSYLGFELLMVIGSVLVLCLVFAGMLTSITECLIALGASVILFLGTLIVGGQRAVDELKRRFHI